MSLRRADTAADFIAGRALFEEYAAALGFDLCFQNFSDELEHIAVMYGPPRGFLLLADQDGDSVGCVGVRPLSEDTGEMKRLYVRDGVRGTGLGRRLSAAAIDAARDLGYQRLVLDTHESMQPAIALYRSLGFRDSDPYYANPMAGVTYLQLPLTPSAHADSAR